MTAKEYLRQLKKLDREIQTKQEELNSVRELACSCSSPKLSDMPKAHNGSDSVGDSVLKIISLQNYINRKIDKLIDLKATIIKQIDGMDNQITRMVLRERYLLYHDWLTIADNMDYSVQHVYRFHGIALMEFQKKYLTTKDETK